MRIVTVFGGSGFVGRNVIKRLTQAGFQVRAAVRDVERAMFLKPLGEVGQVNAICCNIANADDVAIAVRGAYGVVNLVGALNASAKGYDALHVTGPANIAKACAAAGVERLVHISALGANPDSESLYAQSKAKGEAAVHEAFKNATILRPSVIFGQDDKFFNKLAQLARFSPVLPVYTNDGFKLTRSENGYGIDCFGSGGPRFQPVYVGDVAEAIRIVLTQDGHQGRIYELGGPRRYSFKQLMELVNTVTGRNRLLVGIPMGMARIQAKFLQLVPGKPLTPDQVKLMAHDNVAFGGKPGLSELGITPTSAEAVLPAYLFRYK